MGCCEGGHSQCLVQGQHISMGMVQHQQNRQWSQQLCRTVPGPDSDTNVRQGLRHVMRRRLRSQYLYLLDIVIERGQFTDYDYWEMWTLALPSHRPPTVSQKFSNPNPQNFVTDGQAPEAICLRRQRQRRTAPTGNINEMLDQAPCHRKRGVPSWGGGREV